MEFLKYFVLSCLAVYILAMLVLSARSKKAFKYLLFNAILGIFVLLILYFTKGYTGLSLSINKITLGVSGLFGTVGVIGLLFFNLII
ncbi:MAG: pro-sigmaK processing inhibitor BofA family protein [Clostridia bacterium]|nr:pro-sigmaK processing inhibitor BofA family protein [Clostridia bacterium]